MNRNIFLFYLARLFYFPVFWLAILFIYLTDYRGMNEATALLLVGLQEFLLIFLEIPTGAVADRISRKFSCALGTILVFAPLAFLPWASEMWEFVAIFVIKAVGRAMTSGADKSLLYDSLVDIGETRQYRKIITKSFSLAFLFAAVSIFVGGIFVKLGMINWSFWAPLPFAMISAAAFMLMEEPKTSQEAKKIQEIDYWTHIRAAIKFTVTTKEVVPLMFLLAVADGIGVQLKWFYAPVFDAIGLDIAAIGGITAVLYLVKSAAAGTVNSMVNRIKSVAVVRVSSFAQCIAFGFMALALNLPTVVIMFTLVQIGNSMMIVSADELVHEQVSSHHRATVMSTINLISSILATASLGIFGLLQTYVGIRAALLSIALLFSLAWITSQRFEKAKT